MTTLPATAHKAADRSCPATGALPKNTVVANVGGCYRRRRPVCLFFCRSYCVPGVITVDSFQKKIRSNSGQDYHLGQHFPAKLNTLRKAREIQKRIIRHKGFYHGLILPRLRRNRKKKGIETKAPWELCCPSTWLQEKSDLQRFLLLV